jgi:ketosteroid isomerase-like protein
MIRLIALVSALAALGFSGPSFGQDERSIAPAVASQFLAYQDVVTASAAHARAKARTRAEKSLVEAEIAFAGDARVRGLQAAFRAVWADDGVLFTPNAPLAIGPDGVGKVFEGDASDVRWAPHDFAVRGDLGVTWGPTAWLIRLPDGQTIARQGRFVTTWKRQRDGRWKVWTDMGNFGPFSPLP